MSVPMRSCKFAPVDRNRFIRRAALPIICWLALALPGTADAVSPPATAEPPPLPPSVLPIEPFGSDYAASFFPYSSVDGACRYPRAPEPGETLLTYAKHAYLWSGRGRFPLDLDCFRHLTDAAGTADDDPVAAYIIHAWRWLRDDDALRQLTLEQMAHDLRLPEARRIGLPDGFFIFGRKAETLRMFGCAGEASSIAMELGLITASVENQRTAGAQPGGRPGTCEEMLR